MGQDLGIGVKLGVGEANQLWSGDRGTRLILEPTGELVIYKGSRQWGTKTRYVGTGPFNGYVMLSPDGELALYQANGSKVWSNNVHGKTGDLKPGGLILQNDGNLVLYNRQGLGGGVHWASQPGKSQGTIFDGAWDLYTSGVNTIADVLNTLHIPLGENMMAAALTGHNPLDGLKADVSNITDGAKLAGMVLSGNVDGATQIMVDSLKNSKTAQKYLPGSIRSAVGVAINAAAKGNVTAGLAGLSDMVGTDPAKLAALVNSPGYADAWKLATNGGTVYEKTFPAPKGISYKATAVSHSPMIAAQHPVVSKAVPLRLGTPITVPVNKAIIAAHLGVPISAVKAPASREVPTTGFKWKGAAAGAVIGLPFGGPIGGVIGAGIGWLGETLLGK